MCDRTGYLTLGPPGLASRSEFKGSSADAEDEVKVTVLRTVAGRESEADSY